MIDTSKFKPIPKEEGKEKNEIVEKYIKAYKQNLKEAREVGDYIFCQRCEIMLDLLEKIQNNTKRG